MSLIHIAGHLGADPETRVTPSGQKVTSLRIAANTRRGGKDETTWYRITIWGDRFDKMMPYLKKGSAVMVVGTLHKPEIYTDKEGRPQVSLEVTAEILSFSPFGRTDRQESTGGEAAFAGAGYSQQQRSSPAFSQGRPAAASPDFDYQSSSNNGYRFDNYSPDNFQEDDGMPF